MPIIYYMQLRLRRYRLRLRTTTWWIMLLPIVLVFTAGLLLMSEYEFSNSEGNIKSAWDYTWWFLVTAFTVGYGDRFPVTPEGRIIGITVMLTSIATVTLAVSKGIDWIIEQRRKHVKGEGILDEDISDHIVILGSYIPGLTEELVAELQAGNQHETIALVVDLTGATENPLAAAGVLFFRGDLQGDALERCGLQRAGRIIAYGATDEQSFVLAMTARDLNKNAHTVAVAHQLSYLRTIVERFNRQDVSTVDIVCVQAGGTALIVNELRSPGVQAYLNSITSDADGDGVGQHHLDVPEEIPEISYQDFNNFLVSHGARLDAAGPIDCSSTPNPLPTFIEGGNRVYYVGPTVEVSDADWSDLIEATLA